jgi:hypothetical protein
VGWEPEAVTLYIGTVIGGTSRHNESIVEAIHEMRSDAEAASAKIPSAFSLDLVFHVAGPELRPTFTGVRTGRLDLNRNILQIQVAVPESFETVNDRVQFLLRVVNDSIREADHLLKRRGLQWDVSGMRQIAVEVLTKMQLRFKQMN